MPSTTQIKNTYPTCVTGAKELKEYIQTITRVIQDVRAEFENDLKQPKATVEKPRICRGEHDLNAGMAVWSHKCFIHSKTALPDSSEFIQSEMVLRHCLSRLEQLRKMLVNNKQQKKTTIRHIKRVIAQSKSLARLSSLSVNSGGGGGECKVPFLELTYESPIVIELKELIEQVKQNHRTVTNNILAHVDPILLAIRKRHIISYKVAAEKTIGEIIHHAEKCRSYVMKCCHLAAVEYCAFAWWMETQKDPNDRSCYNVSAVAQGHPKRFDMSTVQYPVTAFPNESMSNIQIFVYRSPNSHGRTIVALYDLDQELADTIITDEAIRAFEQEEYIETAYLEKQYD